MQSGPYFDKSFTTEEKQAFKCMLHPFVQTLFNTFVPSSILCPLSLDIGSWKTAGSIKAKFHMEPQWDGGTKVCSNDPGPMTKMATMRMYGKNP